jgi:tetratricopeptide (TPR) repeat protein
VIAACRLWMVRAYGEMGWTYEAEQMLAAVNQNDISRSLMGLFANANADLLLKKQRYAEAIPFLELSVSKEKNRKLKQRFTFLLAQLYSQQGNKTKAYDCYSAVIRMNPPYEMDFNARIYRAELNTKNAEAVRRDLKRMLKNPNNKDYLDKIYFTIGKTYLNAGDTVNAIKQFDLSVENSTLNGYDKALTYTTMGDLYYFQKRYAKAQPCYDEASKILTADDQNYAQVQKRAETLGELVFQQEIVTLQDSLQYLAKLSPEEQLEVVNKLIEKLIADEEAAVKAAQAEANAKELNALNNTAADESFVPVFEGRQQGGASANWYFYNTNLVASGKRDFIKKWGSRKLEDNWRRARKTSALFSEENYAENGNDSSSDTTAVSADSTGTAAAKTMATDNKSPQYYLQQIPKTPEDIAQSNSDLADALYAMAVIYKDKIEDIPLAIETFDEFMRRFPDDSRRADACYQCYIALTKTEDYDKAEIYKQKILTDFPQSRYAEALSHPDFFERMLRMYAQQDSLYNVTYQAYLASDFETVKTSAAEFESNYPLSSLMPKFKFLNALSIGKTESPETFETSLTELVASYPQNEVSTMAKDILALMHQGRESQTGTSSGTLLAMRNAEDVREQAADSSMQLTAERDQKFRLLMITKSDAAAMNKLLFNIASFNFTRFMIKDFDLVVSASDSINRTLAVTNFDNYDEAGWYVKSIAKDTSISNLLEKMSAEIIPVSEKNFGLLPNIFSMDDYRNFYAANFKNINTVQAEKDLPEIQSMAMRNDSDLLKPAEQIQNTEQANSVGEQPEKQSQEQSQEPQVQHRENVALYKNLFEIAPDEPHYVAIVVLSGSFDFEKLKTLTEQYNSKNYSLQNLNISKEEPKGQQIIIIGSFADAAAAKSYLLRFVKEKDIFAELKNCGYRNSLGTRTNLNTMTQKNALDTYFEFVREYYLK